MLNMAVVGYGFVGKAVGYGFNSPNVKLQVIDPLYGTTVKDIDKDTQVIFICVPTPMGDDGSIDSSILEGCIKDIPDNFDPLIVIKSTVLPDILARISQTYNRSFVYNPEFLTEKNAFHDFVNPIMHVFGGEAYATNALQFIYDEYSICNPCPVHHMTLEEASFVKYGMNSFLSTKVLWFNQFYDLVQKNGLNYNKIVRAIGTDDRIGRSHTQVPGFDGKQGFGGPCFPKDSLALYKFSDSQMTVLGEVIRSNNKYRQKYELDDREKEQKVKFNLSI